MGWEGTNAELCKAQKEKIDVLRQLADNKKQKANLWRTQAIKGHNKLKKAKEDIGLVLWACRCLPMLTRDELAAIVEACLGKWSDG